MSRAGSGRDASARGWGDERETMQNQDSYSVARDSGTGSAGSPCLPHLPVSAGTTEVKDALLFAPATFETQ